MFDPQLTLAEIERHAILTRYMMRECVTVGDLHTLESIQSTLYNLVDSVRGELRRLKLPKRWRFACGDCDFAWPESVQATNVCPQCGYTLRIQNVETGRFIQGHTFRVGKMVK